MSEDPEAILRQVEAADEHFQQLMEYYAVHKPATGRRPTWN